MFCTVAAKELDVLHMGHGNMCPRAAVPEPPPARPPARVTEVLRMSHWSFEPDFKVSHLHVKVISKKSVSVSM